MSRYFLLIILLVFSSCGEDQPPPEQGNDARRSLHAIDGSGNLYIAGSLNGSCDFDPSPETNIITSKLWNDYFLAKYNPDNEIDWVLTWDGYLYEGFMKTTNEIVDIKVGQSGNIYICGEFSGTNPLDFSQTSGFLDVTSTGESDAYLVKLTPDGELAWRRTWGGVSDDDVSRLFIDSNENVLVVGRHYAQIDLDPGPEKLLFPKEYNAESHYDAQYTQNWLYLTMFDRDGAFKGAFSWAQQEKRFYAQAVHMIKNKIFLAGGFDRKLDFDPGPNEYFLEPESDTSCYLMCMDYSGEISWITTWPFEERKLINAITVDGNGYIYTTGWDDVPWTEAQWADVRKDEPQGYNIQYSESNCRAYLMKLDESGNRLDEVTWGGDDITTWVSQGKALTVNRDGSISVQGKFVGTVDFDPGLELHERSDNPEISWQWYKSTFDCELNFLKIEIRQDQPDRRQLSIDDQVDLSILDWLRSGLEPGNDHWMWD